MRTSNIERKTAETQIMLRNGILEECKSSRVKRAFLRVLERARAQEAGERMASREIRRDSFTVSGCMARIQRRLNRGTFAFSELFDEDMTRAELITMFMALLEMVKLGRVAVKQEHAYEEIYLSQHAPEPCGTEFQRHRKAVLDLIFLALNRFQLFLQSRVLQVCFHPTLVIIHVHSFCTSPLISENCRAGRPPALFLYNCKMFGYKSQ